MGLEYRSRSRHKCLNRFSGWKPRAIVLDHGGDVALGNRKGGGLRVTISLPLART